MLHAALMDKSLHSPLYEEFRRRLVEMRKAAGFTQRELASKLGREHSFVARIELGERRLDVVEFYWVCQALGADPRHTAELVMEGFAAYRPRSGKSVRGDPRGRSRGGH